MKELKKTGEKANALISIGRSFTSFINSNDQAVIAIRTEFDKPLDTVTDADLDAYFGVALTAAQKASAKAILGVIEDLIKIVKPIRDRLPANDIED